MIALSEWLGVCAMRLVGQQQQQQKTETGIRQISIFPFGYLQRVALATFIIANTLIN